MIIFHLKRKKPITKAPFKPLFQLAASWEKSDIYILNELLKDSSVSLVEIEESRTQFETILYLVQYKISIYQ
jgi:hypothetical protein